LLGGLDTSEWVYSAPIYLVGTYTGINEGTMGMIRTPGVITSLKWWCRDVDAANKDYKIKLFRPYGTNLYNMVYETDALTAAVGTNEITGLSWTVQEGDHFGWWAEDADTEINVTKVSPGLRGRSGYSSGEVRGDGVSNSTPNGDNVLCIAGYGYGAALVYVGDSILGGYPSYNPFLSAGSWIQGLASNSVPYRVKTHEGVTALYLNTARPSVTADVIDSTLVTYATNAGAKVMWVHSGINDVAAPRTWADYIANITSIRTKFGTNNPFFIAEILPASTASDEVAANVRTWNTNLTAWAATNYATLVKMHDAFGQTRGSTGALDDLLSAYSLDGVHLNNTGLSEYAKWIKTNVTQYVK
jgi:lysophospholipase L1-like esterase